MLSTLKDAACVNEAVVVTEGVFKGFVLYIQAKGVTQVMAVDTDLSSLLSGGPAWSAQSNHRASAPFLCSVRGLLNSITR
jgi:hypothetical protein